MFENKGSDFQMIHIKFSPSLSIISQSNDDNSQRILWVLSEIRSIVIKICIPVIRAWIRKNHGFGVTYLTTQIIWSMKSMMDLLQSAYLLISICYVMSVVLCNCFTICCFHELLAQCGPMSRNVWRIWDSRRRDEDSNLGSRGPQANILTTPPRFSWIDIAQ